jgi:hypothetical protein
MHKISVNPEGVVAYGATATGLSGEMTAAAATAAGGDPLLLGPVFGLVGGDFMAAYAAAHAGHVASIGELSAVLGSMSAATTAAAATYTDNDLGRAQALRTTEEGLA